MYVIFYMYNINHEISQNDPFTISARSYLMTSHKKSFHDYTYLYISFFHILYKRIIQ